MDQHWNDMATAPFGLVRLRTDHGELRGFQVNGTWSTVDIEDPSDTFVHPSADALKGWLPL